MSRLCARRDCAACCRPAPRSVSSTGLRPRKRFDAQIALSSLPLAFGTRLGSVPADVPYLSPEASLQELWAERIGAAGFKLRGGMAGQS